MAELKIWNGSAWVTIANANAVPKALFDAHTVLVANSDNAPEALFVDTYSIIGRQAGDLVNISLASHNVLVRTTGGLQGLGLPFNSFLGRQDGAIVAVTVADSRIVGRMPGGNLDDLTAAQVADTLAASLKPKFISNQWYNQSPGLDAEFSATGVVLDTNSILYYLLSINRTVSLDALGIHVVTAEAGKNARVAIYNSDDTPQPTTLVVESDALSLAVAIGVTDPVTETELTPGRYWWAINADSTTAAVKRLNASLPPLAVLGASVVGTAASGKYTEAHALGAFPATATPVGPAYLGFAPAPRFQVV